MKQKCYHFDNIFVTDGDHRKLSAFGAAMMTISLKWWHFRLNEGSNNKHFFMMTSSNGNIFRITGPLSGEFTDHRWIPLTKPIWHGALVSSLICARTNGWVNKRDAGDLRRHRAHYDVTVIGIFFTSIVNHLDGDALMPCENSIKMSIFVSQLNQRGA